jgi:hypothetical protein
MYVQYVRITCGCFSLNESLCYSRTESVFLQRFLIRSIRKAPVAHSSPSVVTRDGVEV